MDWTTDQYSSYDHYSGPLLQYPAKTNSFETKFEADRAMALRMSANPMPTLITPQYGCNDEFKRGGPISRAVSVAPGGGSESFKSGELEKQIADVVTSVGGWFNLILIILVVLVAVYQYKIFNMLNASRSPP